MERFPDPPITEWYQNDKMILLKPFRYIANDGREWVAPKGAILNGATIPKPLWSIIGSPYVGPYRKSSIVHDYFVGEGNNPDVSESDRRKADKMFYEACRHEGCTKREAVIMYIGVSIGTWWSGVGSFFNKGAFNTYSYSDINPEKNFVENKFFKLLQMSEKYIESEDIEKIEELVNEELKINS